MYLEENPELMERIARGELFNLGRHYLALSAMIEVNPLFLLTPNVFLNVAHPGALVQVVLQNDLRENLLLWSAVNLPVGADGSEFGGAASDLPGVYLSAGPSASVQLVWYWQQADDPTNPHSPESDAGTNGERPLMEGRFDVGG